ncbi:uncharacterized protein [Anabrus simplex]|uniref:uncharacterized protein n=1 Tax=Anabrus simplex TaxID=316456 RepID=UPI0034DD930E
MEEKVEIKEEPVWLEGPSSTSFDNCQHASEIIHMKEETKSEVAEPEPAKVDTFKPLADVKDEIFVEDDTVDQLIPCFKEEDKRRYKLRRVLYWQRGR